VKDLEDLLSALRELPEHHPSSVRVVRGPYDLLGFEAPEVAMHLLPSAPRSSSKLGATLLQLVADDENDQHILSAKPERARPRLHHDIHRGRQLLRLDERVHRTSVSCARA
jgi:hypothetical protein